MAPLLSCLLVLPCFSLPTIALAQASVQTGRYTAIATGPTEAQREPLQALISVEFSTDVTTIGEAVQKVLTDTGYALADPQKNDAKDRRLLDRPLPGVQRTLGPMTVLDALRTLAGPAARVVVDPLHRLVTIEIDPTARLPRRSSDSATR